MDRVSRSKGILLSGFENLDSAGQKRKWNELGDLVSQRKGPLRVDRVKSNDGATTLVYLRERKLCEFLFEKIILFLVAPEQLAERENDARNAVAHAFAPYFDGTMRALEASRATTPPLSASSIADGVTEPILPFPSNLSPSNDAAEMAETKLRSDWLKFQQLRNAVLESSPSSSAGTAVIADKGRIVSARKVELLPMQGLQECPIGLSVVPYSPLTINCDSLLVRNTLDESSRCGSDEAYGAMRAAYEYALHRYASDLAHGEGSQACDEIHLTAVKGLRHIRNLWVIPDFVQWDDTEKDAHDAQDWMDFYLDLFGKAAQASPHGSVVLEPWPSYWTARDGVVAPVWTDANVRGLAAAALTAREARCQNWPTFLSVTLAITDATLRTRMEEELMRQKDDPLVSGQRSSTRVIAHGAPA